jgi:hypothetical protein
VARQVLAEIPFEKNAGERVQLIIDKSKSKPEIADFNQYVMRELKSRLPLQVPIDIDHLNSQVVPGLQAVDLFCWGIFRKYERGDARWFDVFSTEKVRFDEIFL